MTWIKVCGLTQPEDVEVAIEAGADAVGLVLVPESPRALTIDRAAELAQRSSLTTIILTRDMPAADLIAAALAVGADGVQPYGAHVSEASQAAIGTGLMVLRPIAVSGQPDLDAVPADQTPLFDSASPERLGGTGRLFDHSLIPPTDRPYVIAGGLGPENVGAVVRDRRPFGVDASSGLEVSPGRKDPELIRRFVFEVRQA